MECKNSIGILYCRESVTHVSMHTYLVREKRERFGVKRPKNYDARPPSIGAEPEATQSWDGWVLVTYYYLVSVHTKYTVYLVHR